MKKISEVEIFLKNKFFLIVLSLINMVFITADTWQKNGVEGVVFNKEKWLNEKHIEEQLGYSRLANITIKYPEYLRKERQELQERVKQPCRKFFKRRLCSSNNNGS